MKVFNRKLKNTLKKKYRNKSKYMRPSVYRLAVESRFSRERRKIEKWFDNLPEIVKPDILARLQSENKQQHFGAYYELVVREFFIKIGYIVDIHPQFGNEQPDLLISGKDLDKPIVIEVATIFDDPEWQKEDQKLNKILSYLEQIKHFYLLNIMVNAIPIPKNIDYESLIKFIINWFDKFDPRTTETIQEEKYLKDGLNLSLTLIPKKKRARKKKGYIIGSFALPARSIGHQQLRNALKTKVSKYSFVKEHGYPYIVTISLVDTFSDDDDVISQLFGRQTLRIYTDNEGHFVKEEEGRDSSGLCKYNHNTRLSGVIKITSKVVDCTQDNWLYKKLGNFRIWYSIRHRLSNIFEKIIRSHSFSLIHNPYCATQLKDSFLNGYPQFKKTEENEKGCIYSWVDKKSDITFEY